MMPSFDILRSILAYDGLTGNFTWRQRTDVPAWWNTKYAGKLAGSVDADGYWVLRIKRKTYKAHRVAWVYVTGRPISDQIEIDHKNGIRADNTILNLRLATDTQNAANAGIRRDNKSGAKGVSWHRAQGKWQAQINENGRRRNLGYFDTVEAAKTAYQNQAAVQHGEYVRGTL